MQENKNNPCLVCTSHFCKTMIYQGRINGKQGSSYTRRKGETTMKLHNQPVSKAKRRKSRIALIMCLALLFVTIGGSIPSMASDIEVGQNENSNTSSAIVTSDNDTTKDNAPSDDVSKVDDLKDVIKNPVKEEEKESTKSLEQSNLSAKADMTAKDDSALSARFNTKKTDDGTGIIITGFIYNGYTENTLDIPAILNDLPVKEIGEYGMQSLGFLNLEKVTVPEGVTKIGSRAFEGVNVKTIVLPQSLETLGSAAFMQSKIENIDMKNTKVTSIPSSTFFEARSLSNINLPKNLEKIESSAFGSCINLTSIEFPDTLENLDSQYIFSSSGLKDINLSNTNVTTIGAFCFNKTEPNTITLNEGLKEIKESAFSNIKLPTQTTIVIPKTVEKIGQKAFENLNACIIDLTSFYPGDIKFAPWGAKNNTVVKWMSDNRNCFWIDRDGYIVGIKEALHLNGETCYNHAFHSQDANVTLPAMYILPDGGSAPVKGIEANAFQGVGHIVSIDFEALSNYKEIKDGAFMGSSIARITLPNTIESIGDSAFQGTSRLKNIRIPDSVESLGAYAFRDSNIESIILSEKLSKIENYTFYTCNNLKEITIPEKVTEIGTQAFAFAANNKLNVLEKVTIKGSGAININETAFSNAIHLNTLDMGEKNRASVSDQAKEPWGADYANIIYKDANEPQYVVYVSDAAIGVTWGFHKSNGTIVEFNDIEGKPFSKENPYTASELVVPSSFSVDGKDYNVNTLAAYLFNEKLNVDHLIISEGITAISNYAAAVSPKITKITFPKSLEAVATQAFYNCKIESIVFQDGTKPLYLQYRSFMNNKLTSIKFPDNLEGISDGAFENNNISGRIEFSENVKYLESKTFRGSTGITEIYFDSFYSTANSGVKGKGKYGADNAKVIFNGSVPTVTSNAIEKNDRGRNLTLQVAYGDPGMNVRSIAGVDPKRDATNGQNNTTLKSSDYFVYENGTYEFEITNALGDTVTHSAVVDDIGKMTITAGGATVNPLETAKITADQIAKKASANTKDLDSGNTDTGISYDMSDADINKIKALKNVGDSVSVTLIANYNAQYPAGALGKGNVNLEGKTYTNTISTGVIVTLGSAFFDVSFDINGGSGNTPATQNIEYSVDKVTEPTEIITYKGYIFDGWYTEKIKAGDPLDSSKKWNFQTDDPVSDMTLYAGWKSYSYTVTFDVNANDATAVDPMTVKSPATTINELPKQPVREGYTFEGWTMNKDGTGGKFNDTTEVTGDMTVYAQWAIGYYQLSFNLNGATGKVPDTQSIRFGGIADSVQSPVWEGYKFLGWNTSPDGSGVTWNFTETKMPAKDVVLYAQWEKAGNVAGEEGKGNDNGKDRDKDGDKGNGNDTEVLGSDAKTGDSMNHIYVLVLIALAAMVAIYAGIKLKRKE